MLTPLTKGSRGARKKSVMWRDPPGCFKICTPQYSRTGLQKKVYNMQKQPHVSDIADLAATLQFLTSESHFDTYGSSYGIIGKYRSIKAMLSIPGAPNGSYVIWDRPFFL